MNGDGIKQNIIEERITHKFNNIASIPGPVNGLILSQQLVIWTILSLNQD